MPSLLVVQLNITTHYYRENKIQVKADQTAGCSNVKCSLSNATAEKANVANKTENDVVYSKNNPLPLACSSFSCIDTQTLNLWGKCFSSICIKNIILILTVVRF